MNISFLSEKLPYSQINGTKVGPTYKKRRQSGGEPCGTLTSNYIVTDIEDSLGDQNDFCYGYKQDDIEKPSEAYIVRVVKLRIRAYP